MLIKRQQRDRLFVAAHGCGPQPQQRIQVMHPGIRQRRCVWRQQPGRRLKFSQQAGVALRQGGVGLRTQEKQRAWQGG